TIFADKYTPIDATMIPTGELAPVEGTPLDFRKATTIGARIGQLAANPDVGDPGGYDHNYVLNDSQSGKLALAARVHEPKTGRIMEVLTKEPGMQLYTGNFLPQPLPGKGGKAYGQREAFCLETQKYPDSINQPSFPSVLLEPGRTYRTTTVYRFLSK
ncbi:MAG: galactose-1-epimerase, partial [Planctomycetota bacterium]